MKEIGGYFELELNKHPHYHENAIRINSARNCLEIILILRKWKKVYIPYYTCEAIFQPLDRQKVEYSFYPIDKSLDPSILPRLNKDEAFLYTNYFGLKQNTVSLLEKKYGEQLIVDNAQAFFAPRLKGVDTFYSPRKFFGVPDGGYLYTDIACDLSIREGISWDRMSHLCKRIDLSANKGYQDFQHAESSLNNAPIEKMSKLTDALLSNINYGNVSLKRRENFDYLDRVIGSTNRLHFSIDDLSVPMIYPFICNNSNLRDKLIRSNIYVAKYWGNVNKWCCEQLENDLSVHLIPLPIDQRYSKSDLDIIISSISL